MSTSAARLSALAAAWMLVAAVVVPFVVTAGPGHLAGPASTSSFSADRTANVNNSTAVPTTTETRGESPSTTTTGETTSSTTTTDEAVDGATRGTAAGTAEHRETASIGPSLRRVDGTVQVVVRMERGSLAEPTSAAAVETLRERARSSQQGVVEFAKSRDGVAVVKRLWLANAVLLEVDTRQVSLESIAGLSGVDRLHRNFAVELPSPRTADEDVTTENASLRTLAQASDNDTTGPNTTYGVDMVDAPEVWRTYDTMGGGVKVAVLDTGVQATHQDIDLYTENPDDPTYPGGWAEFNASGGRVEDSRPHETLYHGTHVSGTVAGGNASGEYIGVAPNASLMHGLVLPDGRGTFAQIVAGMEWAVEEDADVVSMSLGVSDTFAPQFVEPVQNARRAGTMVVASAGNCGAGCSGSPGNLHSAFSIGAVDENASVATFSSGELVDTDQAWGGAAPDDWPDQYVVPDVSAPGVLVKSAFQGNDYQRISGTSMAAPHVAGVAALLLAATDEGASPATIRETLKETAFKPDEAPDGADVRYGVGIVNAKLAADKLAADSGVAGVVDRRDGFRVAGATVSIRGGLTTQTDFIGAYSVPAPPGTYTVVADGRGYEAKTKQVNVTEDTFATLDFTLNETIEAEKIVEAADSVGDGDEVTATFRAWHFENVTVHRVGNYTGNATLFVEGPGVFGFDPVAFGEEVNFSTGAFGGPRPDPSNITIRVETNASTDGGDDDDDDGGFIGFSHDTEDRGNLVLNVTIKGENRTIIGANDSVNKTVGPVEVYRDRPKVGVVVTPGSAFGDDIAATLDRRLPTSYEVTVIEGVERAAKLAPTYDAFVVQNVTDDVRAMETFVRTVKSTETGVVYLNQFGPQANAVNRLRAATDSPRSMDEQSPIRNLVPGGHPKAINDALYKVEKPDHPIFDGVNASPDGFVKIKDWGHISWADGFDGSRLLARSAFDTCNIDFGSGTVDCNRRSVAVYDHVEDGAGIAVDELSRTVIATSSGWVPGSLDFYPHTNNSRKILVNAVEWASEVDQHSSLSRPQPEKVEPGEPFRTTIDAEPTSDILVELDAEHSTVDAANLTLQIRAEKHKQSWTPAFGERVNVSEAVGGPVSGPITVAVLPDANVTGTVSLDHTLNGNSSKLPTINGSTGPTKIYEEPITVGEGGDAETLSEAFDLAEQDSEVVLTDGTYGKATVDPGRRGLTIRVASGADPVVRADDFHNPVIEVLSDEVTIRNVTIEAQHSLMGIGFESPYLGEVASGGVIRNVSISGSRSTAIALGGGLGSSADYVIADSTITDASTAISMSGTFGFVEPRSGIVIRNNTIEAFNGIGIVAARNSTVEHNRVRTKGTAILLDNHAGGTVVRQNVVQRTGPQSHPADGAVTIEDGATGRNLWVVNNTIESRGAAIGIVRTGQQLHIKRNRIDGGKGLVVGNRFVSVVYPETPTRIESRFNDLSETGVPVENTMNATLDASLNFYGPTGPSSAMRFEGPVRHELFLPQPPSEMAPSELSENTTSFATAVNLEAGETYAVGVPGPADATVDEVFSEFEGVVYGFDADSQSWTQLTGDDSVEPLRAMLVIPRTDTRLVVSFQTDAAGPSKPAARDLEAGWNFVAAPSYGDADEVFGLAGGEPSVVMGSFAEPTDQPAPAGDLEGTYTLGSDEDAPRVSPFAGYFVFAREDGALPGLVEENPTADRFREALGIAPDGASTTDVTIPPRTSAGGLYRLQTTVADDGPDFQVNATVADAVVEATRTVAAAAPDDRAHVAAAATRQALGDALARTPVEERLAVVTAVEEAVVQAVENASVDSDEELASLIREAAREAAEEELAGAPGPVGSATAPNLARSD